MGTTSLQVNLDDALRAIAVQGSYGASRALSKWVARPVRVHTDGFLQLPLGEFGQVVGAPDEVLTAVHMVLEGDLQGDVLLTMPEEAGAALVDMLTRAAPGTTQQFGELEQSCLKETGNIVGSAFTNALASWLDVTAIPAAPTFVHDLSCAIIQPLLMQQAMVLDAAWLNKVEFELEGQRLDWSLMLFPGAEALEVIRQHCSDATPRRNALQAVAINTAHCAAATWSDQHDQRLRIATEGFHPITAEDIATLADDETAIRALSVGLSGDLDGELVLVLFEDEADGLAAALNDRDGRARRVPGIAHLLATALANTTRTWLRQELVPTAQSSFEGPAGNLRRDFARRFPAAAEVLRAELQVGADGRWFRAGLYLAASRGSLTTDIG